MDSGHSDPAANNKKTTLLGCLLVLSFLVYANTLTNRFVYDDHSQIEQNPSVHGIRNIGRIFAAPQTVGNYYRPLMNIEFLLSFKLFGASPYGFHLINVLLHCVVVWLVYEVGVAMTSDGTFGLIAAACFALHPIHTESVDWIADVADIEMSLFYLLAFWLFVRLGRREARPAWIYAGMLGSFFLATLSKEPAVTLPAVTTIYEHFCRSDRGTTCCRQKLSRYGAFWAVALAYFALRALVLHGFAPVSFHADIGFLGAARIGLSWIAQYAAKLSWPVSLSVFYPLQQSASFFDSRVLSGAAVLIASATFVACVWQRARIYAFALVWIFVTLAPVLNVRWIPMDVFAERYLYLPSVGFCWLLSGGFLWCWRESGGWGRHKRWALGLAAAVVGLLASAQILARNRDWKDDRSLALRTLQTNPDDSSIRADVGMMDWRTGDHSEAISQWRLALAYRPDSSKALADLGFAMVEQQNYLEAIPYLQKAIQLSPQFASPHANLARTFAALGKIADAELEFRRAVEISPTDTFARNSLGRFYLQSGRLDAAEAEFKASSSVVPNLEAWSGLAEAYSSQGASDQAADAWRHVLAIEPFDSHAHLLLARIYLSKGLSDEAVWEFDQCLYTDPHNAEALAAIRKLRPQETYGP